ncbi:MAG: thiol peroxidase [Muribaculum sp.]|nr:thiol peroxidase [Muribaculaceae bacterium]MCM1080142.1 thiol peroxidase [Muribaculum sp.]
METIYFQGNPCHTYGMLPAVGTQAPDFTLVTPDLKEVHPTDYKGKKLILNIFPSLDTAVCAMSVRKFNQKAAAHPDTAVLCVSMDLPFAAARFCSAEGIKNVLPASAFRAPEFVKNYGVEIVDGPLKGLLARAVVIIGPDGKVIYRELVEEITHEPDYEAALKMLK